MKDTYSAFIIEDDSVNIRLLTILLEKYCPNIEIVGEARNTVEFTDLILTKQADILLLDIDLGEERNTLEILNDVDTLESEIIIISSHEEYALKAINQHQVSGYLIKPINSLNLTNAIHKAIAAIKHKKELLSNTSKTISEKILALPTATSIEFIEIENILYLEADGKYTVFYLEDGTSKVVSKNIGSYEKLLPEKLFFRIHHKYIINIKKLSVINRSDGNYCQLTNGKSLSIAKRRQEELRRFLNLK